MNSAARHQPVRWLLLGVLALGLIAMHHTPAEHGSREHAAMSVVAMTADPSPMVSAGPMTDDHGMGAMLHQCLAVLGQLAAGALLVLLLVMGFARLAAGDRVAFLRARARSPDRPDRPGGRSLLTSVCVLRL